jgi:two-component sensor histidine kinase
VNEERRTVLLVEGDGVAAAFESRELEDAGYRVLETSSAEAAAEALSDGSGIDLVVMDASLASHPSLEFRGLPILFLYSPQDSAAVEKVSAIPSYGFVARGEDAVVLAASVRAALALADSRSCLDPGAEAELRLMIERKVELMKELQHRVKNGLNLASSLLRLQMDEVEEGPARKAMHDAVSRLRAMAAIYEKLSRSEDLKSVDLGIYLEELAEAVFHAFVPEASRLRLSARAVELRLDSSRAVYLGLILTELLTNAVKYAYPTGEGEIVVSLEREGAGARLRVSDTGQGFPPGFDPEASKSLGLSLVRMLASQIGAELDVEGSGGVSVTVSFSAKD